MKYINTLKGARKKPVMGVVAFVAGLFSFAALYNNLTMGNENKNEAYWLREGYSINSLYEPNERISMDGTATSAHYRDSLHADSSATKERKPAKNLLDRINPKAAR